MTVRVKAVCLCNAPATFERVYGAGRLERLAAACDLYPDVIGEQNASLHADALSGAEVAFSTWGMPALNWDLAPKLRAVFYAAGSVKAFAGPLLARGVLVVSAWAANAVPVAEFTVAQILLAHKGYFRNTRECRVPAGRRACPPFAGPGNYGETVALLGAGQVGRAVVGLLRRHVLKVVVWDPFLSGGEAQDLGVEAVAVDEAFRRGLTVSNHLADVPATRGLLRRSHFAAMRPGATFINTGRGATVHEPDLVEVLLERPDLTALLDVTWPEPPADDSPLYRLPNVHLSSHIAGSLGDEVVRMADCVLEEFAAWREGRALRYAVTPDLLATMA